MLLNHRYKFLFVHVAKTGGTSFRAAFNQLRWKDPLYYLSWPAHKLSGLTGHRIACKFPRHAHVIAAKEMLPAEYFDSLFKFAVVRNPWDLQVSSFHHIQRERPQHLNGITNFNEFMRWKFNPDRPYQYHIDTSLSLQTDYLVDLKGEIVVDYIARYENLLEDFSVICDQLNIQFLRLPHKRKSERVKAYRDYYAEDTRQLVEQHFKRDIELLGFKF